MTTRKYEKHRSHTKYRPDIDGLRGIAVILVLGFHAFPHSIEGGFIGVDIFFVISGFLISTSIFDSLHHNVFSLSDFYSRRIRRIFPSLAIVLAMCFMFGWFTLLLDEFRQLGHHIAGGAGFISNFLLWNESGYFDNAAETKPLLHLWSLGIEEQFYLVWPLLLWWAWKKRYNIRAITIAIALGSFAINIAQYRSDTIADFYSPQTRCWELLAGSILASNNLHRQYPLSQINQGLAIWYRQVMDAYVPKATVLTFRDTQSIVGTLLIALCILLFKKEMHFPGFWAVLPVLGTVMIVAADQHALINRFVLSHWALVWLGLISFPLYLWHWPLLSFVRIIESNAPSTTVRIAILLLSIVLAWLTYQLIERPLRFGKHGKQKTIGLMVLMTVIGAVGYYISKLEGIEFRSGLKQYKNNANELIRTKAMDRGCQNYTNLQNPVFPYCKFTDVSSQHTVAIIGDSHAHVAYPGIAKVLSNSNINTILLANSGCPPFLGAEHGKTELKKNACKNSINQIVNLVLNHEDISHVFIFSRGQSYISGKEFGAEDQNNILPFIPSDVFKNSLQNTIDLLRNSGKKVYYINENFELGRSSNGCIPRPFRINPQNCIVQLDRVLNRQRDYLSITKQLSGVTVINPLEYFCANGICTIFSSEGALLYADDNHLSVAGSDFQANTVLRKYLADIIDASN